ncbi:hypothetical protein DW028_05240 [Agathobacter rectalis]|uniref:Uncharacterized protein n=2 Tax=Lachnospiraceae TaxID=186803 RepID=A0A415K123_9FIRM|nr:hypothetical protein DW028_05240 [Agathobacter rectalis]
MNRIYKYRNNKIIQWVFLLAVVLLLLVIMISYLPKEFMNSLFIDIIWDILFVVLFIYISILCMKNIRKLRNIKIDSLSVRRAVITEKQSVKSKDLINRSRNRFVAAKIDDNVTLYAMCSQKEYERTIVNKSIGLFFTLGDDTIRVIVL